MHKAPFGNKASAIIRESFARLPVDSDKMIYEALPEFSSGILWEQERLY
jgi:hypothetical protein